MTRRSAPAAEALAAALGAWFDGAARDLPWRRDRRPYAVWLSEIMLQQTRVETVIPYFERFLSRYPDVSALAAAEIDDVLHLWSGLGYYRRARQLHAAARAVAEQHGGVFPSEPEALRALPGVGPYTAGAVASIAYGRRAALVDGNVARVLARVTALELPLQSPAAQKKLWALAEGLVPAEGPGRFNEALMELGATVCIPREPRCEACPIARLCAARAEGRERELPVTAKKREVPVVEAVAAVIEGPNGELLLARRREGGLFGGLWEPPLVEALGLDEARASLEALGISLGRARLREAGRVTHVLTHRRMEVVVATGTRAAGTAAQPALGAPYEKAAWLDPETAGVGVSTLARKVIAAARGG